MVFTLKSWILLSTQKPEHRYSSQLFLIAKTWQHPRYPLVDKWINKMCYIETMETYLVLKCQAIKRHGRILLHITTGKKQSEKAMYIQFKLYDVLEKTKLGRQ